MASYGPMLFITIEIPVPCDSSILGENFSSFMGHLALFKRGLCTSKEVGRTERNSDANPCFLSFISDVYLQILGDLMLTQE